MVNNNPIKKSFFTGSWVIGNRKKEKNRNLFKKSSDFLKNKMAGYPHYWFRFGIVDDVVADII